MDADTNLIEIKQEVKEWYDNSENCDIEVNDCPVEKQDDAFQTLFDPLKVKEENIEEKVDE